MASSFEQLAKAYERGGDDGFMLNASSANLLWLLQTSSRFWAHNPFATLQSLAVLTRLTSEPKLRSQVFSCIVLKHIPPPAQLSAPSAVVEFLFNLVGNVEIRDRVFAWGLDGRLGEVDSTTELGLGLMLRLAACTTHAIKQQVFDLGLLQRAGGRGDWVFSLALNLSNDNALVGLLEQLSLDDLFARDESTTCLVVANLALQAALKPKLYAQVRPRVPTPATAKSYWGMMNNLVAGDLGRKRDLWVWWTSAKVLTLLLSSEERGALALAQSLGGEEANAGEMSLLPEVLEYALERNLNLLWNLASFECAVRNVFAWLEASPSRFPLLIETCKQVGNPQDSKSALEVVKIFCAHPQLRESMFEQFKQDELFQQVIAFVVDKHKS